MIFLSLNQLKEASQNNQTSLVIYNALNIITKVRQNSIEIVDLLEETYKNEGNTLIILTNIKQWYRSIVERIHLDEVISISSPEQVVAFYRAKWQQPSWAEEVILEDLVNSLRSVVVAIQAGMQMLRSEIIIDQSPIKTLEEQTVIFVNTYQLLREYLTK